VNNSPAYSSPVKINTSL